MENSLHVDRRDFRLAMKLFAPKRLKLTKALLSFENGFLSIESGARVGVMHAEGQWNGRATFAPEVLRALAEFPPNDAAIIVSYADGHLLIGGLTIPCTWQSASKATVARVAKPSILDLLALERTMPRVELLGTDAGRSVQRARRTTDERIRKAANYLADFGITLDEVRQLVEARITARLQTGGNARNDATTGS